MTNRVVFDLVAKRAEEAQAKATSLASPVKFETAAGNILYAANRIKELEEQVEALTKINAQLCNILEDKGLSKEEIQKIEDYV